MKKLARQNMHTKRGFTLVETLVAITILVLSVVGPMTMASRGLQSAFFAKEQFIAVLLNQEAVEFVRKIRDENALNSNSWLTGFHADCTTGVGCGIDIRDGSFRSCSGVDACKLRYDNASLSGNRGFYTYSTGDLTQFTRVIRLLVNGDEASVESSVTWQSSIFQKTVTTKTLIFNQYENL